MRTRLKRLQQHQLQQGLVLQPRPHCTSLHRGWHRLYHWPLLVWILLRILQTKISTAKKFLTPKRYYTTTSYHSLYPEYSVGGQHEWFLWLLLLAQLKCRTLSPMLHISGQWVTLQRKAQCTVGPREWQRLLMFLQSIVGSYFFHFAPSRLGDSSIFM